MFVFQPYSDSLDNRAELVSLYVLLVNYFSSIARSVAGNPNESGLIFWFWLLLVANVIFVVVLGGRVLLWVATDKTGSVITAASVSRSQQSDVLGDLSSTLPPKSLWN